MESEDHPGAGTDQDEGRTQSFVMRLWVEDGGRGKSAWRGHITHVGTSERRHVRRLEDISLFIVPYLEQLGADIGWCWRTLRWIRR